MTTWVTEQGSAPVVHFTTIVVFMGSGLRPAACPGMTAVGS